MSKKGKRDKGTRKTGDWRHYAPCFLSKGWTETGTRGGRFQRFVEGRDVKAKTPGSWGAELGFYRAKGLDIDPGWQETENADAVVLDRIREEFGNGGPLSREDAYELIGIMTRLALRTKSALEVLLARGETLRKIYLRALRQDGHWEYWKAGCLRRIRERRPHVLEIAREQLREAGNERPTQADLEAQLGFMEATLEARPAEFFLDEVQGAGRRYLTTEMNDELTRMLFLKQVERTQNGKLDPRYLADGMQWGVVRVQTPGIVLGDGVVVEKRVGKSSRAYRPGERTDLEVEEVICPISPTLYISGKVRGKGVTDAGWIPGQCAALALESFIAKAGTADTDTLHRWIGSVPIDAAIEEKEGKKRIKGFFARVREEESSEGTA